MVDQLTRSLRREEAFCTNGARCPSSSPVTTTARTPEAPSSSAGR